MGVRFFFAATVVLGLSACISAPENQPEKADPAELEPLTFDESRNLFILHCESCHGIDGKKKSAEAADLSTSTLSDDQVRDMILNGNDKGMMPYKDILTTKREVDGVIEYVKSLRKQN